ISPFSGNCEVNISKGLMSSLPLKLRRTTSAILCTICWMYIFSVRSFSCPKSHTNGIMLGGSAWTRYTSCLRGTEPSLSLVSSAFTR
uniref:Uncharacterized protein n=1 Tax=Nothoprocta perdicaria TaxID=30464 RepID=A0A8C7EEE2_NOTPE